MSPKTHLSRTGFPPIFRFAVLLTCISAGAAWLGLQAGRAFVADDAAVAGTLTGAVYQDYNANGRRDTTASVANNGAGQVPTAVDRGIAGVTVTAYDASGAVAGTATSGADGAYSLNAAGNGPYRLEFTNLPAGFQPGPVGTNSGTHVRFVDGATASGLDFGIVLPAEYCQDNPTLITACYVGGAQSGADPVIVSFPNSAGSTRESGGAPFSDFDAPAHGNLVRANQVGTVWGLAYARGTRTLYASSFMKKHAGFGPGGPGAIYTINPANGNTTTLINIGAAAGANPHNQGDFDRDNGDASWNAVGKVGFGGIALNGAETRLYAMNLADRTLYEITTDVPPASASRRTPVPANLPGCGSANDVRPFAVHWNAGQLYVGLTCTAESTVTAANPNGNAAALAAYVYRVDPATLAFDAAPLFQFALNYPRRCADGAQIGSPDCFAAAWRPWTPGYRNIGTELRGIYPQPWLTDIAFDRGHLILGIRDRSGDQFGTDALDNPADNLRYYGVSAGDTLRAAASGSGFTLESNGRAGGQGTGPQNTGEGPGGGEFYFRDNAPPFVDENGMGALLQLPGFPHVAVNSTDPIPLEDFNTLFDGGTVWMNDTTGGRLKGYRVYDGTRTGLPVADFGKANGLGDLVALCDLAPIEIGNRVFRDTDCDGIQDANEPGISGVRVELFKNGAKVGETTTNAMGGYLFNASNVPGGVLPNMDYRICIDRAQALLAGLSISPKDADASANGDARDSDAMAVGTQACLDLTTGGAGASNHSYDFGFAPVVINCPPNQTVTAAAGATSAVVNYPAPTTKPAGLQTPCNPSSGSTFPVGTTRVECTASDGVSSATCSFTVTVNAPPTITCPANLTQTVSAGATTATVNYPAPTTTGSSVLVTCAPSSGSAFPIGTTTVNCTATNSSGSASCSFTVTVNGPPTITCPANLTQVVNAGVTSAAVTYPAPTTTGSGVTVTCLPASGASFPLGQTTVTCTATNAGGSASRSFRITVIDRPSIVCPASLTATAAVATGTTVTYPAPAVTGQGTTVSCTPASGSNFPLGTTAVKCTATNAADMAMCSFNVTVALQAKCDTLCYRSPQYWLLNINRLPGGTLQIVGGNGEQQISTDQKQVIKIALQGNPFNAALTPRQALNREYVAAQLNILSAGGPGSPVVYNTMWANLSCYGINFAPVTLSNGVTLVPTSMVKELYMQITLAVNEHRADDYLPLATILDLLTGNDPLGVCN